MFHTGHNIIENLAQAGRGVQQAGAIVDGKMFGVGSGQFGQIGKPSSRIRQCEKLNLSSSAATLSE